MPEPAVAEVMDRPCTPEIYLFKFDIVIPECLLQVIGVFTGVEAEYFYGVHSYHPLVLFPIVFPAPFFWE